VSNTGGTTWRLLFSQDRDACALLVLPACIVFCMLSFSRLHGVCASELCCLACVEVDLS